MSLPHDLAGPRCDGQVLVSYDLLGISTRVPPFVNQYARLDDETRREGVRRMSGPHDLAQQITIGAGPRCDGQVLVSYDLLGISTRLPPFVKQYARLGDEIVRAVEAYAQDVRESRE